MLLSATYRISELVVVDVILSTEVKIPVVTVDLVCRKTTERTLTRTIVRIESSYVVLVRTVDCSLLLHLAWKMNFVSQIF